MCFSSLTALWQKCDFGRFHTDVQFHILLSLNQTFETLGEKRQGWKNPPLSERPCLRFMRRWWLVFLQGIHWCSLRSVISAGGDTMPKTKLFFCANGAALVEDRTHYCTGSLNPLHTQFIRFFILLLMLLFICLLFIQNYCFKEFFFSNCLVVWFMLFRLHLRILIWLCVTAWLMCNCFYVCFHFTCQSTL